MADNKLANGRIDPKDYKGQSPEVSEKEVKVGVYVIQEKDEEDRPIGEKRFVASNDPTHVEAFLHNGYRKASENETKEFNDKLEDAKKEARTPITKQDEDKA